MSNILKGSVVYNVAARVSIAAAAGVRVATLVVDVRWTCGQMIEEARSLVSVEGSWSLDPGGSFSLEANTLVAASCWGEDMRRGDDAVDALIGARVADVGTAEVAEAVEEVYVAVGHTLELCEYLFHLFCPALLCR